MGLYLRILALLVTAMACGCNSESRPAAASQKATWPEPMRNVNSQPEDITIVSGTTFQWGGKRCQLLGVKDSDDPSVQKQANEFTRAWFKSIGNRMAAYNHSNPLIAPDGSPVVWIRGYDLYLSCLSEELVRVGLVEIDDQWPDYTFIVPTKEGETAEDWRGILRKAKEGHSKGEKPRVLFEWLPR